MAGLLDGMRVLDFSVWRPLPHGTQILADLGAEVLKVEPPGGDPMRAYPELFASVARGKRSIVIDLRDESGRGRAVELAAQASVVCEGWRPGVADRLGVGYETVAAANPAVVYCSLTGYGQTGPRRDTPGHDVNYQALAGALAPRRDTDRDPEVPRLPAADLEGGTMCALLICAAWARRLISGVGERIDVAMADAVAYWVGTRSGVAHADAETRTFGSPGYGVFRTADGQWIALGILAEQRLWEAICNGLGLEELATLAFAERLARTEEINAALTTEIGRLDAETALARLDATGAPVSPVLRPEEVPSDPHYRARGLHVETDAGLVAALPAQLVNATHAVRTVIPGVGEHPEGFSAR